MTWPMTSKAGRTVREWEVLEVPQGTVRRSERDRYARLVGETRREAW